MNERILKLMEEAGIYDFVVESMGINEELNKFAELIVKECAEIAKSTDSSDGDDYRSGRYWAGLDIKKHFGVE